MGSKSTFIVTKSDVGKHNGLDIVHCKVTAVPGDNPVMVVFGELGFIIVAEPDTNVHSPVPTLGVFAAIVVVEDPHISWSAPAFAFVGAFEIVMCTVSVTAAHKPFPVEVSTKFVPPALISELLGVYVLFKVVVFGENAPLPNVVHMPPVAFVIMPFKAAFALFPQTVWSVLALTIGFGLIVTVVVNVFEQPILLVVVKLTV